MKRRNLEFEEIEYLVLISTIAACAILDVYVTLIRGDDRKDREVGVVLPQEE